MLHVFRCGHCEGPSFYYHPRPERARYARGQRAPCRAPEIGEIGPVKGPRWHTHWARCGRGGAKLPKIFPSKNLKMAVITYVT